MAKLERELSQAEQHLLELRHIRTLEQMIKDGYFKKEKWAAIRASIENEDE